MKFATRDHPLGNLDQRPRKARQMAQAIEWLVFRLSRHHRPQDSMDQRFLTAGSLIIIGLAALNFAFAVMIFMYKGLIGENPLWMLTRAFCAAAVPAAVAVMTPHDAYATRPKFPLITL